MALGAVYYACIQNWVTYVYPVLSGRPLSIQYWVANLYPVLSGKPVSGTEWQTCIQYWVANLSPVLGDIHYWVAYLYPVLSDKPVSSTEWHTCIQYSVTYLYPERLTQTCRNKLEHSGVILFSEQHKSRRFQPFRRIPTLAWKKDGCVIVQGKTGYRGNTITLEPC